MKLYIDQQFPFPFYPCISFSTSGSEWNTNPDYWRKSNGLSVFVTVYPSDRLWILVFQRRIAPCLGSAPFLKHAGHSRISHCNPGYFMPGTSCSILFASLHVSLSEAYAHTSKQTSCVFQKVKKQDVKLQHG